MLYIINKSHCESYGAIIIIIIIIIFIIIIIIHLLRMEGSRWPKKIYQWTQRGRRRGRPIYIYIYIYILIIINIITKSVS